MKSCISGLVHTNPDIFETAWLLHESAFRPHETNESAHRNRIFSKWFPRVIAGPVHTNLVKRIGGFINVLIRVDGA